ncbi:MAG TPA: EAL domain-containing protein [Rhodanobacteraceae bacterium]|nr:EAL domain-containing protein [Rhodanobacteraceae bacterium]
MSLWLLLAAGVAQAHASAPVASATWQAYQRNFYFQRLDGQDGLVQNSVGLIYQDREGYMWLATQGGLFRYDGYSLKRFVHDPDRPDSLPESFLVTALADAGNDKLWVGSITGGLLLFDPRNDAVLPLPPALRRDGLPITGLQQSADGDVLVASTLGLDRLVPGSPPTLHAVWREPHRGTPVHALTRCPDGTDYAAAGSTIIAIPRAGAGRVLANTNAPINALHCDAKGQVLVGTDAGLARVDRTAGALTPLWPTAGAGPVAVQAVTTDDAGRIWIALANHSLVRIAADGSTTTVAPTPAGIAGGLPDAGINALFIDRTGLLWIGTRSAGVAWTNPDGSAIRAVLNLDGDPRTHGYVRGFLPTGRGQYWVALSGAGLVRYDATTHTVTSYAAALHQAVAGEAPAASPMDAMADGPAGLRTYGILQNADGTLWLPSNRGLLSFDPATGKATLAKLGGHPFTASTRAVLRTRDGDLWVAPRGGGLVHYRAGRVIQHFDRANGLASDDVLAIAQDHAGSIWAGTTRGASLVDPATGKVRSFHEIPGDDHSLAGRAVVSLLVTHAGQVWIGSLSGLSHLTQLGATTASFRRYGLADGLPDVTIDCLLEAATGDIWFSTNLGVARLDPHSGAIRAFGVADGLQGNEYNSGACLRTTDGHLLFGGHGFDIIDPTHVQSATRDAPLVITDVYAGATPVPVPAGAATPIRISARGRSVEVGFATLDYAASDRNRFRYRLLGRDQDWSAASTLHRVAYDDLDPGAYKLEIQVVLPDGTPGRTATLALEVANAWWWTPAMRAIYTAALALLIFIAILGWRSHHQEQVRHRRQLRLRESRLRHALWGSGDQFWDWNLERGTILRLGPEETPGGHHEESVSADEWRHSMVHPDDLAGVDRALSAHLTGKTEHFEVEHRARGPGGEWTWVLSRGKVVERDPSGKPLRVCGTEHDISALRAADRDRRIASEVIRNMSEAVAVTDLDYRFVSVNTAFTRMTGYAEHEVLGHDAAILNGSRHGPDSYTHLRQSLAENGHWRGELWQRRKDGEEFLCWVELNEVCDATGQRTHMIGVLTDITDRKRAEQELRYLANYDTLTGLPNRALLGERLGAAVINARRNGHKVAVLFLDLDRFKHVNDSLGHTAGDRTLKATGARLRQYVRENDVVARLGGDEFTVVLEDLTDVRSAEEMAQRLLQAFSKPLAITSSQETVISPSIGIAMYPDHGQTPADLLKCADTAMYHAKERGRNTWAVYHEGMDARARDHATMVTALRRALDRNELHMVYQPKMALADETITGMEALLRWRSPELGDVSPSVFIPLAEETGQIHDLSSYVFATACADLRRFRAAGHTHLTMAINLSAAQLNRPDLTLHICDMLAEHDVIPSQVELELTESMVMANAEQSVKLLGELKSIGARLAIDDFGTGYSSLAYLKRLPIDTLKIDQTFVRDITTDPDDAAITSTIITMAHSLQLRVVAEGVETPEQLAFLRTQHCDIIQGYWLSRPLAADACLDFLNRHATLRTDPA